MASLIHKIQLEQALHESRKIHSRNRRKGLNEKITFQRLDKINKRRFKSKPIKQACRNNIKNVEVDGIIFTSSSSSPGSGSGSGYVQIKRPVNQYDENGDFIAHYESIWSASKNTGINPGIIHYRINNNNDRRWNYADIPIYLFNFIM